MNKAVAASAAFLFAVSALAAGAVEATPAGAARPTAAGAAEATPAGAVEATPARAAAQFSSERRDERSVVSSSPRRSPRARRDWVPGQVLVQRRDGVRVAGMAPLHEALDARVVDSIAEFHVQVVDLDRGDSVASATRRYARDPRVLAVEPNFLRAALEIPNDSKFDGLWGLRNVARRHPVADAPPSRSTGSHDSDIDAVAAWDRQKGLPTTVIAVLDSGADLDHPDLDDNLWTNPDEVAGDGLDNDANGYVDDIHGWDFQENDAVPQDTERHGTHVAGTIAGEANNSFGVAGVCRECRVMILKFGLTAAQELDALAYARDEGADIVNGSFGGPAWSRIERDAFVATGQAGVLSVIAAGNEDLDNDLYLDADTNHDGTPDAFSPSYPASYTVPSIVSVGASNHKDQPGYFTGCATRNPRYQCAFTNWGHDAVDLAAPGVDIRSTVPGGSFATFDGTSMASPHVAGVAGLVKSSHPTYSVANLKNALLNSVNRPTTLRRLRTFSSGVVQGHFTRTQGRVNAWRALEASTEPAYFRTDSNIDGARVLRDQFSGAVRWPNDSNDVYKRFFSRGVDYEVTLDGPGHENLDLLVWKPGTLEIWQIESGCYVNPSTNCKLLRYGSARGGDEAVSFTANDGGTYYLQVSAGLKSRGDYKLRVRRA